MIVAGFGYRGAATLDSLADALMRAKKAAGIATDPLVVATVTDKANDAAMQALARKLNAAISPVGKAALAATHTQTQSDVSRAARGTGSVAEAAALVAAGETAALLGGRVISEDRMATCALAQAMPPGKDPIP